MKIVITMKKSFTREVIEKFIILIASGVLLYLIISLYFTKHFYFNTIINGVDVSLKSYNSAEQTIKNYIKDYDLVLIERDGSTEDINGQNIGMEYSQKQNISSVFCSQNSFKWIKSLFREHKNYIKDLYVYDRDKLEHRINLLNCLNKVIIEPQNVSFNYSSGSYEVMKEVDGNKIIKDILKQAIIANILKGNTILDLNENHCYEAPNYTLNSEKTLKTKKLLNKYVSTCITYKFGDDNEKIDGTVINKWLYVDKNLDVIISKIAVMDYVKELSRKYDTVGITRKFKTSTGKIVEISGGLYGWKIDQDAESKALIENIKLGETTEIEPIYAQRAFARGENEIGNTYVEINITKQHVWFYKDGKFIIGGAVVTGNPSRGNATVTGTNMLNYKQKEVTLTGVGYEANVTYWMPFYGNIGLHDASWRYAFGGEIYKTRGSHGCVNAPKYLAKKIFENIEEGTPVISYEEE
jgi:hypothetical protein